MGESPEGLHSGHRRADGERMNEHRTTLVLAAGVASLALGVAGLAVDLPVLGTIAGVLGAVAALVAARANANENTSTEQASSLTKQVGDLESALADQVQARLAAEESIRSLGAQLVEAQHSAARPNPNSAVTDQITDSVTGLFSEDYFRIAVDTRIAAARRHLRPVGVVLLEVIEGLRTATPQAAPPVLVSETINDTLREADTACRLLDGRFALVLEDTSENGAIWTVERIRRNLVEAQEGLTLRAGIACYPAHAFGSTELLQRASDALIAARDWNQDRIEVASAES
jgi:two-component system cell cycle response regulator